MAMDAVLSELDVSEWVGEPQRLADLRGQVVLIEAFQMLCPACVSHGLPQAKRVQAAFPDVRVIGLHTVFEHHEAMGPPALRAFLGEYRIDFPVGVDRHDGSPIPVTMRRLELRGTPSTLLVDRSGRLRLSAFGVLDDLVLGARIGRLLAEAPGSEPAAAAAAGPAALATTPQR